VKRATHVVAPWLESLERRDSYAEQSASESSTFVRQLCIFWRSVFICVIAETLVERHCPGGHERGSGGASALGRHVTHTQLSWAHTY
jgi:hypothetical protein